MDTRKEGPLLKTLFSDQHPQVRRWLVPFILACFLYFLLWIPEDQPSWFGALVKCLPILCLVVFLAVAPGGRYSWLLQGGLVCSAVGDACLIWPGGFLYGMAAFFAAHLLYIWAFGLSPLQPGPLLYIIPVSLVYYSFLLSHLEPGMVLPVLAYGLTLLSMLWRSLVRGGSAGWGGVLFTISDGVLAWNAFIRPLPFARLMTMSTYYAAQLLLALSALRNPGLKTH
ncbi:lysoplasmalogenase [Phodopus roborovskii]|uniref:Lysoplasmalogenase TMEM86B n=1 Tax=Phodopus roborovskii TaxID=109678 RepID=A0AAV0AAG8_PHORO|nr:lysoplasmalogenase [Phodopus roborovskii]CAH7407399.1 Tmem86b [Phodopus roborovskii]